ncbi:MAG: hypothetical protein J2P46_06750 [Zavarzinella sp.]|nr:hypothetical protein [Zavarzinella sp.]
MVGRLTRLAAVAAVGLTLAAGLGLSPPVGLAAAEPSWEGNTVLLTRAGVRLQAPEGQDIALKTSARLRAKSVRRHSFRSLRRIT